MYTDDQSPMSWLSGLLTRGRQIGDSFDGNCSRNSIETEYHPENNYPSREKDKSERMDILGDGFGTKLFDSKTKRVDTYSEEDLSLFTPHRNNIYSGYNYYPYHHMPSINKLSPLNLCQPVLESQFRFVSSLLCSGKLDKGPITTTPPLSSMSSTSTNIDGVYDPFIMPFLSQPPNFYPNTNSTMEYSGNSSNGSVGSNNTACGLGGHDRKIQVSSQPPMKKKVGNDNFRPANAILLDEHFDNMLFSDQHKIRNMYSLHSMEETPINSTIRSQKDSDSLHNSECYNFPLFNTSNNNDKTNNNNNTNSPINGNNMDFLTYRVTRNGKKKVYSEFGTEMNDIRTVSTASGDGSISNSICDSMSVSETSEDAYIKSGRGRRARRLYDDKGTKISGVWYDASRHLWRVVYLKGDKRKTKGFSILKLGFEQARRQAIAFRQQMAPQK